MKTFDLTDKEANQVVYTIYYDEKYSNEVNVEEDTLTYITREKSLGFGYRGWAYNYFEGEHCSGYNQVPDIENGETICVDKNDEDSLTIIVADPDLAKEIADCLNKKIQEKKNLALQVLEEMDLYKG